MKEPVPGYTVYLLGRYYATLSVLPYLLATVIFFFIACFFLVSILFQDMRVVFDILLLPFLLGMAIMMPFTLIFLFMIRWHGKRRLEMDPNGMTLVLPNDKQVFIPWDYLIAVELRFSKPRLIQCTLVTPGLRFSFNNLEINLDGRRPLKLVYEEGFGVEKLREFLYYLHRVAPHMSWRMSQSFRDQYRIHHPPYDLEKLA